MEYIKIVGYYIVGMLVIICCVWTISIPFANKVKQHEVIEPEKGVHCVVVSRMFNTSVDCWRD